MPGYKSHMACALVAYTIVIALLSFSYNSAFVLSQWLLSTLAGALFPDIDTKSMGQKLFYTLGFFLIIACLVYKSYQSACVVSVAAFLPILSRHRGMFHNFWLLIVLVGSCALLVSHCWPGNNYIIITNSLFFLLGVISHLWLDKGLKKMLQL